MVISQSIRTALIGAGPRGTSVLERLLANWAPAGPDATLHIDVVDPYPAGPGHVWQPGQSRLYLMNTQSFYPTVIPEDPELASPLAGDTFDRWRERQQRQPHPSLTAEERAELAGLGSADFPSRALYGRYLRSTLEELLSRLPAGVSVEFHETTAVSVRPAAAGAGHRSGTGAEDANGSGSGTALGGGRNARGKLDVGLEGGAVLTVDSVVLALGHLESRLNPEQRELKAAAEELGLLYLPPSVPADVDWSLVPAARPVLVRGMGLNFFDVMGQLTEGRGGTFVAGEDGRLGYRPSGREPLIIAASRRGTPYRAKAALAGYYPSAVTLRYCTESALARFAGAGIQPAFDHDLWPLLHRDAIWAYYSTLARSHPGAILSDPAEFLQALEESLRPHAHSAAKWEDAVDAEIEAHVRPAHRLNLLGLAAPLAGRSFGSRTELDAAVVEYLLDDARRSALGEDDPVKMTIGALHHGRAVLKSAVADGGITDESWVAGLRGWFESFVEGLASGPPALRAEQLAALARAGVVRFVGPDPKFGVDREAGTFTAASPWVDGGPGSRGAAGPASGGTGAGDAQGEAVAARSLIEALAPANRVTINESPLLEQLLSEGLVRARLMMTVEGVPVQTSGLDVVPHPYRPLGSNGSVTEGLYVLGLQLSAAQWGTAIAAEARQKNGPAYRSGQRTLHDADEIARDILGR
ncbi:putative NAD(P)/FAD-binding protein YdhS [Arthrobacter sp. V4I6]|uniref:FAD/NAD(P)-binding protein n=1 Tax=unclassified Arthrobacter TaxID=235627 RepID=UPI00278B1278|nr:MULTISPECIES: FAD/NAD(P)-binding protein [unclassified Arthrobacter]MDQ0822762.1 putative NAD(P)/FAD-binding protein YdhS [Arthrobacter sp. V1I7]MDQ0852390.1 putative NAD(P)/FAD-binding protein YdhS [Arthrobacter sp. V4I6]